MFENIAESNRQMSCAIAQLLTDHLQHNKTRPLKKRNPKQNWRSRRQAKKHHTMTCRPCLRQSNLQQAAVPQLVQEKALDYQLPHAITQVMTTLRQAAVQTHRMPRPSPGRTAEQTRGKWRSPRQTQQPGTL